MLVVSGVLSLLVIALLLTLAGAFHRKIDASAGGSTAGRLPGDARLVPVRMVRVPLVEPAVGTIRAVHEVAVAAKLLAKAIDVNVVAGQRVQPGDVLVQLDDADLRARVEQAEAAVVSARAERDQAQIEFARVQSLMERQQAAPIEMDRVSSTLKSAEAQLARAEQVAEEARTILDYATVRAPIGGTVIDKQIEAGDTAQPGQVLVTLYDPDRMQLVASVRESLAQRLAVGQDIDVRIDALERTCTGAISEIVPEAERTSRSFLVKVTGPCPSGVYSGMFGRLLIPLDEQEVLVVPQAAVRHVGQLDLVEVASDGHSERRTVLLGRPMDGDVEVLAGLRVGEQVVVPSVQ